VTIPGFQDLTLPVLEEITRRGETRTNDLVQAMADRFNLTTEERTTLLPSGRQTVIANRVHWAIAYLSKAILLERTRRAHYRIAERGQQVLASPPPRIDLRFLERYPEIAAFRGDARSESLPTAVTEATPDEVIRAAHRQIEAALRNDLIERILQRDFRFFETLVLKVLLAMGYGGDPGTAEVVGPLAMKAWMWSYARTRLGSIGFSSRPSATVTAGPLGRVRFMRLPAASASSRPRRACS
jgi:restriction system protein